MSTLDTPRMETAVDALHRIKAVHRRCSEDEDWCASCGTCFPCYTYRVCVEAIGEVARSEHAEATGTAV